MSDQQDNVNKPGDDQPIVQKYQHQSVAARVPEKVARGVYCTGQIILDSPKEFVIDFLQALTRPHAVVARVVLHPQTMAEFITALRLNVENYTKQYGPPPQLPPPPQQPRPSIQEIYENIKLPEDLMAGAYANTVLIGHSITEFFFDFITSFYPTSAVATRIFLPAPQVPRFLNTLTTALQQYQVRYQNGPVIGPVQAPPVQQPPTGPEQQPPGPQQS